MMSHDLILGTAQINSNYGINNNNKVLNENKALSLLGVAKSFNIKVVDTALNYQNSYSAIEKFSDNNIKSFTIIDKVDAISVQKYANLKHPAHWPWLRHFVKNGGKLCLMLHSGNDYKDPEIRASLQKCKELNLVSSIGVSIYDIHDLQSYMDIGGLDVIQLPLSIVSRKDTNIKLINKLNDYNIKVHIRSIFLQGLLLELPKKIPHNFNEYKKRYKIFSRMLPTIQERIAICFASVMRDITGSLVIGADNNEQLKMIIKAHKLAYDVPNSYIDKYSVLWEDIPEYIIDPRMWYNN